jgi:hypothetical protein
MSERIRQNDRARNGNELTNEYYQYFNITSSGSLLLLLGSEKSQNSNISLLLEMFYN